ncbi:MAG: hypothetical protein AAFV53_05045 [Myxococcota bacterium]
MDPVVGQIIHELFLPVMTGAGAVFSAWLVAAQLRWAGITVDPDSDELNWPRLMGLLAGAWVVLIGLFASSLSLGSLLGDLAGVLSGLTIAGALLTGISHHRRRRLHAAERSERPRIQAELRWVSYAAMGFSAMAVTGLSLSLPALILIVGIAAVYVYSQPDLRHQIESGLASFQAGQQLRTQRQLTVGDQLGDVTVAGPVGLTATLVRDAAGEKRAVPNDELLIIAADAKHR